MPDDAADGASLELTIRAAALAVADDVKEADRREIEQIMRKDVLEVDTLSAEIKFISTEVTGARRAPARSA